MCTLNKYELRAKAAWNKRADGWNQWHELGQDEKDDLIAKEKKKDKERKKLLK